MKRDGLRVISFQAEMKLMRETYAPKTTSPAILYEPLLGAEHFNLQQFHKIHSSCQFHELLFEH